MKKITFLTLIFAALFVFLQMKALACSCVTIGNLTLEQEMKLHIKNDKAVFVGKLISINDESTDGDRLIKFQVERFWKGALTEEIAIATENERNSCAYPFEKEKTYLIYVNTYNNKLYTGGCIPNREISRADEELKILGKGSKPKRLNLK
jgi:hypothetical protein